MTRPDPSDLMDIDKVAYALPVKQPRRLIWVWFDALTRAAQKLGR